MQHGIPRERELLCPPCSIVSTILHQALGTANGRAPVNSQLFNTEVGRRLCTAPRLHYGTGKPLGFLFTLSVGKAMLSAFSRMAGIIRWSAGGANNHSPPFFSKMCMHEAHSSYNLSFFFLSSAPCRNSLSFGDTTHPHATSFP